MNDKNLQQTQTVRSHSFTIENRKKAQVTGVNKVIAATSSRLSLDTSMGGLIIEGADLSIGKFSDADGTLSFDGNMSNIKYVAAPSSLVKKLFK